jgi:peptide/nickel transport system permease protein
MDQVEAAIVKRLARRRRSERRWARLTLGAGAVILGVVVLVSVLHPLLGLPSPDAQNLNETLQGPSSAHLFGTDDVGRDVLSRSLAGMGLDLRVAVTITAISVGIGVTFGALAGFLGGIADTVVMRLADVVLAFPFLVLVIAIIAAFGPGLVGVYVGIPTVGWAVYARLTRAEMLGVRERDFVNAARTLGYPPSRILLRHALPNVLRPALVYSMIDVVLNIVALASLSYLGLGVQPPTPELGAIIAGGQQYLLSAWWISTLPGLLLVVIGVGFSFVGDGLAELLGRDVSWAKR